MPLFGDHLSFGGVSDDTCDDLGDDLPSDLDDLGPAECRVGSGARGSRISAKSRCASFGEAKIFVVPSSMKTFKDAGYCS